MSVATLDRSILPTSESELCDCIRSANSPFDIRGGGTRRRPRDGTPLSTAKLTGISLYEPGAMTIVAGAGTPIAEIEAQLSKENQRLAFEPTDMTYLLGTTGQSTIGGVIATNASGPRRMAIGAARDHMLGVRFVDGQGRAIKNGGRVMKNVTGYDLVKLMTGSWGTLGVMTEVSLKVLPTPDTQATLTFQGLSDFEAIKLMSAALTTPYEVSGAAHLPGQGTYLRLEGFEEQVTYRTQALSKMLARMGEAIVTEFDWQTIRDAQPFHGRAGDVWRISLQPSKAAEVVAKLATAAHYYDWGGGLAWILGEPGYDLRADLTSGHATCVRGAAVMFHPQAAGIAKLSAGLRAQFDPRGLFNPGLME